MQEITGLIMAISDAYEGDFLTAYISISSKADETVNDDISKHYNI